MDPVLLRDVAASYGTPCYVYDLDAIEARVARLRRALPDADLRYAVKANPNGAVLARLAALELGAEAITLGELERAHRAGMPPARLLLGGPGQDPALIERARQLGVALVSLDSRSQWLQWRRALPENAPGTAPGAQAAPRFLVRVNPALDPDTHEHLATGAAASKFGLPAAAAGRLAAEVAERGRLAGFHVHAGSQITELDLYDDIARVLAPLYRAHPDCDVLDLGGGFGVPGFDEHAFAARVRPLAERFGVRLLLEPGRWLVADAGVLLTRLLHVKGGGRAPGGASEGARRHLIADAGMAELLRPALYGAHHPVRVLEPPDASGNEPTPDDPTPTDLDGPLCENADRLGRDLSLPELAPGALLAVERAGAYGFAMASNYASSLRPAEVVVSAGRPRLARRRETPADLWRLETDLEEPHPAPGDSDHPEETAAGGADPTAGPAGGPASPCDAG